MLEFSTKNLQNYGFSFYLVENERKKTKAADCVAKLLFLKKQNTSIRTSSSQCFECYISILIFEMS